VQIEVYFKAAGIGFAGGTLIGSGTTTAGVLTVNSGWTDNTVPSGSKMWAVVASDTDATTVNGSVTVTGSYD